MQHNKEKKPSQEQKEYPKEELIDAIRKHCPEDMRMHLWGNIERLENESYAAGAEAKAAEVRGEYDEIFKWLLGESGDFPNLSEKSHYSFRTELRERLSALTPVEDTE